MEKRGPSHSAAVKVTSPARVTLVPDARPVRSKVFPPGTVWKRRGKSLVSLTCIYDLGSEETYEGLDGDSEGQRSDKLA